MSEMEQDGEVSDIVPDDVDAETLKSRLYDHTATDTVGEIRCPDPECGSPSVTRVKGGMRANTDPEFDFRCQRCGNRFDRRTERSGGVV
jgi:transposase-like protein